MFMLCEICRRICSLFLQSNDWELHKKRKNKIRTSQKHQIIHKLNPIQSNITHSIPMYNNFRPQTPFQLKCSSFSWILKVTLPYAQYINCSFHCFCSLLRPRFGSVSTVWSQLECYINNNNKYAICSIWMRDLLVFSQAKIHPWIHSFWKCCQVTLATQHSWSHSYLTNLFP